MERFRIDDVAAGYGRDDLVLDGITLAADSKSITAVIGPNGCGKSTSLRAAMGLISVRRGRVILDGEDITALAPHERLQRGLGLLPQGRSVFPSMTVLENLEMGAWLWRKEGRLRSEALAEMLERYPLLADLRQRPAGTLSGGQQRILEIARMMMSRPQVVLIDEPGAGLSPRFEDDVYDEIERIRDTGKAVLLVDQNVETAIAVADYVYVLELGRVLQEGPASGFAARTDQVVRDWLRVVE